MLLDMLSGVSTIKFGLAPLIILFSIDSLQTISGGPILLMFQRDKGGEFTAVPLFICLANRRLPV